MLTRTMITPRILEVREDIHGCNATWTRFFYTDIVDWTDLTNPFASKQTEDFKIHHKMSDDSIEWCKRHHLPNIKPYKEI